MLKLIDFQESNPFPTQIGAAAEGQVRLMFIFSVPQEVEDTFVEVWARHGHIMGARPGWLSENLHKSISSNGTNTIFLNYAHWNSLPEFTAAFSADDSQANLILFPDGVTLTAQVLKRVAVENVCESE